MSARAARTGRGREEEAEAATKARKRERRAAKEAAAAVAEEQQALAEDAQAAADANSDDEASDAEGSDAEASDAEVSDGSREDGQLADAAAAQMALLQERLAAAERRAVAAEADAARQRAEQVGARLRTAEAVERMARRGGGTLHAEQRARAQHAIDEALQRRRGQEGSSDDEEAALVAEAQLQAAGLAATEQRIRARRDEKERSKRAAGGAQRAAVAVERAAAVATGLRDPNAGAVAQRSLLSPPLASPPHGRAGGAATALRALGGGAVAKVPEPPAPKELTAEEAGKPAALADWIYAVERLLRALQAHDFDVQIELAGRYWDRSVQAWWEGALLLAEERGQPVDSWQEFRATLTDNYSPVADADEAEAKLFALAMRAGEKMEAYVARAQELYNRVPRVRLDSQTAAGLLLRGVDKERFPMTYAGVSEAMQNERKVTGGRGLQFEAIRARLVEAAVRDPGQWLSKGSSGSSSSSGSGASGYRKQRVAAVATGHFGALDDQGDETTNGNAGGGSSVNAVNVADMKCFRCQERGHTARECKKPDKRTCYGCGKVGHLRKDCQDAEGTKKGRPKN